MFFVGNTACAEKLKKLWNLVKKIGILSVFVTYKLRKMQYKDMILEENKTGKRLTYCRVQQQSRKKFQRLE